jgi:outer membrane protein OmpA-like peptidoglycan-associated protein
MNDNTADRPADAQEQQQRYAVKRPSQYSSQTHLSLGVIAGLLLVIPVAIFLRKGYLSQQPAPVEQPLEPVVMSKSVPSLVAARGLNFQDDQRPAMLYSAFGDRIGTEFDYPLPGDKTIRIPAAGFEERFLSDLNSDEIPQEQLYILDRLYFAPASVELGEASQAQIEATAAILQAFPALRIQLRGHTDSSGDEERNLEISEQRAHAVMVALIKQGVLPVRITIQGMGSEEPVADNDTAEGRERNRRIDLSIVESFGTGPSVISF